MAPRFSAIKFNLLKAVELFGDMNHEDMDVIAPPSAPTFFKEHQLAERLNEFLVQLVDDGFFDDCDLRVEDDSDEYDYDYDDEDDYDDDDDYDQSSDLVREEPDEDSDGSDMRSTPRSSGFEYESSAAEPSPGTGSRESFSHRFKRYLSRIIPGRRGSRRSQRHLELSYEQNNHRDNETNLQASARHEPMHDHDNEQDSDAMLGYTETREPPSVGHDEVDESSSSSSSARSDSRSGRSRSATRRGSRGARSRSKSRSRSASRRSSRSSRLSSGSRRSRSRGSR